MAEQGARDVTDAVTRGLQDVTQLARRSVSKGSDAAAGEPASPNVDKVAADPATYFMAEQQPDERGLPSAIRAKKAKRRASRDFEIDGLKRRPRTEALTQALCMYSQRILAVCRGSGHAEQPKLGPCP